MGESKVRWLRTAWLGGRFYKLRVRGDEIFSEKQCISGVSNGSSAPESGDPRSPKGASFRWGCVIHFRSCAQSGERAANRSAGYSFHAGTGWTWEALLRGLALDLSTGVAGPGGSARWMACHFRRSGPCARTILRRLMGKEVGCQRSRDLNIQSFGSFIF